MLPAALSVAFAFTALPVADFVLPDPSGTPVRLSAYAADRPVVIVFLGTECPVANLYAPRLGELARTFGPAGVQFLAVDPLPQDGSAALARFAKEHRLPFPVLKDPDARVSHGCGAVRTPHAVLLDASRRVRYRGRIDDQYEPNGKNRGTPSRSDLAEAIRDLLAGRPVRVPDTPTYGCLIPAPPTVAGDAGVTYHRDIAPILQTQCQPCHRPGEVAPFALLSYADACHWAPMIAEVTAGGTMPPWHANPEHGRFRNERRLTAEQKRAIRTWADGGCPEGDPADAPAATPLPGGWGIGRPDVVLEMPTTFRVPAEGVIEYQHAIVDPHFETDTWVAAAELRPGNRRVVHHCLVYLHPPGVPDEHVYEGGGTLGSHCFLAWTPGSGPMRSPAGTAKRVPAGWKLHLVIHYAPIGTPADDRTALGLVLADAKDVRREMATKLIRDDDLRIPPGVPDHRVEKTWVAERDVLLLSLFPHMHVRGKSFRYAAEYPDGLSEVLLDVPAYDFNWQHRYELAEPKRLPAGTIIRCTAVYDNSPGNPSNPDPTAEVRTGYQSWDEMFNGYFEMVLADEDRPADGRPPVWLAAAATVGLGCVVTWVALRPRRSSVPTAGPN